jgi:hypothetical protein
MKKLWIALCLLTFVPATGSAQVENTLIGPGFESGGFGAPVIKMGDMYGRFSVLLGGRGGWVINRTLMIGGGGYGLVSSIWGDVYDQYDRPGQLRFGYGGLDMELMIRDTDMVHLTLQGLIGGGGVGWRFDPVHPMTWDAVFVAEPGANLELNVLPFMRITAGATYRWVQDVQLLGLTNEDMSGWTGTLMFKFGRWGNPPPRRMRD